MAAKRLKKHKKNFRASSEIIGAAWKATGLIEKETDERRTSNIDGAALFRFRNKRITLQT
jgi:hypothetical protein